MTTAFYGHSSCIDHQPGPSHPESPERLKRIYQILGDKGFDSLKRGNNMRSQGKRVHLVLLGGGMLTGALTAFLASTLKLGCCEASPKQFSPGAFLTVVFPVLNGLPFIDGVGAWKHILIVTAMGAIVGLFSASPFLLSHWYKNR